MDWQQRIRRIRPGVVSESQLGDIVEAILREAGVAFTREHRFPDGGRVDFLVGRTGVELKINPSGLAVWRQLHSYAEHVDALILLSTKAIRMKDAFPTIPTTKGEIPVTVLELWRNF